MTVVQSKYSILSNKPLHKEDIGEYKEIIYVLPEWFVNWNKTKLIKVYGCSFAYLDSNNKVPIISSLYQNQFISVHSNIVRDDTQSLNSAYLFDGWRLGNPNVSVELLDEARVNADFMMVANNFYTPKIYNLTNSTLKQIEIYFKDATGTVIPLRTPYYVGEIEPGVGVHPNEIRQAVFKIEIELATAE
jgi:hypothetical protein